METLTYIDSTKYNIIDVVRSKTSIDTTCVGTIGKLFINDEPFCETLEPYDLLFIPDTPLSDIKYLKSKQLNYPFKGQRFLAIPTGVYDIDLKGRRSSLKKYIPPEYNNCCPLIQNIPGYSGVYIHVGNLPSDTQGCLLVGDLDCKFKQWKLINSTSTFHRLLKKLWSFKFPIKIRYSRLYES